MALRLLEKMLLIAFQTLETIPLMPFQIDENMPLIASQAPFQSPLIMDVASLMIFFITSKTVEITIIDVIKNGEYPVHLINED